MAVPIDLDPYYDNSVFDPDILQRFLRNIDIDPFNTATDRGSLSLFRGIIG